MMLRVKCPNGCLLRLSSQRLGTVVRCPGCKMAIRIGGISNPQPGFQLAAAGQNQPYGNSRANDQFDGPAIVRDHNLSTTGQSRHWGGRMATARRDRILLSRFFAGFMLFVAAVNMTPAVYYWYCLSRGAVDSALPAWAYMQIFVASLHVIYAIFVFQIADWSSLKAVSVVLLIIAVTYGFISAALLLGGSQGIVATWLGLPTVMMQKASIWCVAMLLLATMAAYVCGREALAWQRTDELYQQILSRK